MKNNKEDNYDIICKRIQELVVLFETALLSQDELSDIVVRITKLNKMLEILGRK